MDLTKSDEEGVEDENAKLRRKLGLPEMDPDALPSSCVTKYLILNQSWILFFVGFLKYWIDTLTGDTPKKTV